MRGVTLLALWFTVYGNINKTWENAMIYAIIMYRQIKQLVTDFDLC